MGLPSCLLTRCVRRVGFRAGETGCRAGVLGPALLCLHVFYAWCLCHGLGGITVPTLFFYVHALSFFLYEGRIGRTRRARGYVDFACLTVLLWIVGKQQLEKEKKRNRKWTGPTPLGTCRRCHVVSSADQCRLFLFWGARARRAREDEGGWLIRRCDLIPARFDMWPLVSTFFLSLTHTHSLSHLPLTCLPAPTPLGDD